MLPRDLNGKEIQKKRRDVCIRRADSLCCTVETNIIVKQLHFKKKKKKPGESEGLQGEWSARAQFSDWLMVKEQGGVTKVNFI